MEGAIAVRARDLSVSPLTWVLRTGAIAALMVFLYASVMLDLASEWWTQSESSYGILIPPFALYIAHLNRKAILRIPAEADWRGLGLILSGCLLLLTGQLAAEFFLSRISFVVVLAGLVWTFWGYRRLQSLAFPLILLMTMVPLPGIVYNLAAAPLQLFASKVSTVLAQALGISIYRDGNIIHLATTSLGVAEACSGLHSLCALSVASLLLGFLNGGSIWARILMFLISIPLAIVVNVMRVTGTAILADYNLEFALGYYHAFSGWLVFVMGLMLLWLTGKFLIRFTESRT